MKQTIIAFLLVCFIVVEAQAQGQLTWARSMGGAGTFSDFAHGMAVDADGNVYTTGRFQDTADFDPGSGIQDLISVGNDDIFVCKLSASGDLLWAKSMGSAEYDYGYAIAVDAAGNVYVTGQFMGTVDFDPGPGLTNLTSAGGYDIFVCKLNALGELVWVRCMGGFGTDTGYGIAVDSSGNVLTAGYFHGTADFDGGSGIYPISSAGMSDAFVCKLNASGDLIWARSFAGPSEQFCFALTTDAAGNVFTAGTYTDTADFDPGAGVVKLPMTGTQDIFISKLDADGNYVWAKSMGGTDDSRAYSIALDAAGNIYTTGYFDMTTDFDPGSGVYDISSTAGSYDIYVSKMNPAGDLTWARSMGGSDYDFGQSVAADAFGNVYIGGYFRSISDLDPGTAVYNLSSAGDNDIFVCRLDSSGNFVWASGMGGAGTDEASSLAVDDSGNVFAAGVYLGACDFDPGSGVYTLTSAGSGDAFVVKLNNASLGIGDNGTDKGIIIYPNPAADHVIVTVKEEAKAGIYDLKGVLVQSLVLHAGENNLEISSLSSGIYCLKVKNSRGMLVKELVKR